MFVIPLSLAICFALFIVGSSFRAAVSHSRHATRFFAKAKGPAPSSKEEKPAEDKNKLTFGKIVQLVGMGAGAPMLGEFKEVDERGRLIFELEANNYGKELDAKYFKEGYVEKADDLKPPGFFQNLFSGGRLQSEWEEKIKNSQGKKK
jgi:hypothetical protein